jgi:hypothetical protein
MCHLYRHGSCILKVNVVFMSYILSRILVTRQVINGFSGLKNRFIGQSPSGSTNTYNQGQDFDDL